MMAKILITPRSLTSSPGQELTALSSAGFDLIFSSPGRQPTERELLSLVPGCVGWLAGVEPINAKVLAAADRLTAISRNGTGIDSIDLDAARQRGIKVLATPGANAAAVAELTLAFMIAGLRHLPESADALKEGRWHRPEGREVGAAMIGLIGCGAVGRAVARAVSALGATVLAYDLEPDLSFRPSPRFLWTELEQLLSASDVVSLHCPALTGASPLLDGGRIRLLKPGAGLVNTARASLIDDEALLEALNDRHVGWYATDVFAVEPPHPSPLLSHQHVLATPHIGGFTAEGGRRAVRMAVENLLRELGAATIDRQAEVAI